MGKNSEGYTVFPLLNNIIKWERTVRGTLFYPFLIILMGKNSEGYTLLPLLDEGKEGMVANST